MLRSNYPFRFMSTCVKKSLAVGVLSLALTACASTTQNNPTARSDSGSTGASKTQSQTGARETYSQNELVTAISDHMGVTAESAATAIERIFSESGEPVGYITGEEGGGALTVGLRYGKGTLWMKNGQKMTVYWQGPTIGFDVGGDASKVFTLVYNLDDMNGIFRRFPGVDGSAYLIAGMAVNYQRAYGITLAPIRSGVGLRLGAKVGYTKYTRERSYMPL